MSKRQNELGSDYLRGFDKRVRLRNARTVRLETSDPAFTDGVLDVASFVKLRTFELEELEKTQLGAKHARSTRVFQALPRKLRRRGASHNVKRIPKRLRNKAIREMMQSNGNNDQKQISLTESKKLQNFKKKISSRKLYIMKLRKNLLKAAIRLNAMKLVPGEQLKGSRLNLRQTIKELNKEIKQNSNRKPTNNTYGSYDNSGIGELAPPLVAKIRYLKRQQKNKWISTHIWHAKRFHLIKRWGWNIPYKPTQKSFRLTHRAATSTGSVVSDTSYQGVIILESFILNDLTKIIKQLTKKNPKIGMNYKGELYHFERVFSYGTVFFTSNIIEEQKSYKVMISCHPANFKKLWEYLKETSNCTIYDCSQSIGSINLYGPELIHALTSILQPVTQIQKKYWMTMSTMKTFTGPTAFTLECEDPRLFKKPMKRRCKISEDDMFQVMANLKTNQYLDFDILQKLLSPSGRQNSYAGQMTIKELNKKRSKLSNQLKIKIEYSKNLQKALVPILFLINSNGHIQLFAPWFWIGPIWNMLVRIPKVVPGGLLQESQILFENKLPYFPNDYPFTKDGYIENELIGTELYTQWKRKQKNKRVSYNKIIINENDFKLYGIKGEPFDWFQCDWRRLQLLKCFLEIKQQQENNNNNKTATNNNNITTNTYTNTATITTTTTTTTTTTNHNESSLSIWDKSFFNNLIKTQNLLKYIEEAKEMDKEKIARAEILEIPIVENIKKNENDINLLTNQVKDYLTGKLLLSDLLNIPLPVTQVTITLKGNGKIKSGSRIYQLKKNTNLPSFEDLIGFVTTGSLNLKSGKYLGIASIASAYKDDNNYKNLCFVRCVGSSTFISGMIHW